MNDFYILRRGWMDHPLFFQSMIGFYHSRREAWLWLIEQSMKRNGQLTVSVREVARAWRWGEGRARYFLQKLQAHGMVNIAKQHRGMMMIEIVDFEQYLLPSSPTSAPAPAEAPAQHLIAPIMQEAAPRAQGDLFASHGGSA